MSKLDEFCWTIIKKRNVAPSNFGPKNYQELEQQVRAGISLAEIAFPHLLDYFYRTRDSATFALEPGEYFTPQWRAFLAGVAEYLSRDFGFSVPTWVEKPEFFLAEPWTPLVEFFASLGYECPLDQCKENVPQEFLRRKIFFEARGLIRI